MHRLKDASPLVISIALGRPIPKPLHQPRHRPIPEPHHWPILEPRHWFIPEPHHWAILEPGHPSQQHSFCRGRSAFQLPTSPQCLVLK